MYDHFRALNGFATDYISVLGPMLKMEYWTEREFHALLILAYCDIGKLRTLFAYFEAKILEIFL